MGGDGKFRIDLEDEVVRGSISVLQGKVLPPVSRPVPTPATPPPTPAKGESIAESRALTPWQKATREVALVTAGMGTAVTLGKLTGATFMSQFTTFGLAGLVGYRVVWNVAPALHSPLMSVTNAISGKFGWRKSFLMSLTTGAQEWLALGVYSSWAVAISQARFRKLSVHCPCYWLA
jgi:NAD(P) transhydrogenase